MLTDTTEERLIEKIRKRREMRARITELLKQGYTSTEIRRALKIGANTYTALIAPIKLRGRRGYNYLLQFHPDALRTAMQKVAQRDYNAAREILCPLLRTCRLPNEVLTRWFKRANRDGLV